jgi:hypothetical protein
MSDDPCAECFARMGSFRFLSVRVTIVVASTLMRMKSRENLTQLLPLHLTVEQRYR